MRTIVVAALAAVVLACSTFDGVEPWSPQSPNWGEIYIEIHTIGLSAYDQNIYTVVLDSAIQGYAVRRSLGGMDTVWIEPVIAGRHRLSLRGVRPYCEVEDGPERDTLVVARTKLTMRYRVDCVYPDGTSPP